MEKQPYEKWPRWLVNSIILLAFSGLCYEMGQWTIPFIVALILAYAFHAPSQKLANILHVSTTISAGIIILSLVSFIFLFATFSIPILKNAMITLIQRLPDLLKSLPENINNNLHNLALTFGIDRTFDVGIVFNRYLAGIASNLPKHMIMFIDTGMTLVYIVMFAFMTPILTFYILKDWSKIEKSFSTLLNKFASPTFAAVIRPVNSKLGDYIRGQLIVCFILACTYTVGLLCIGVERYIICGIISGLLSIAPFFGPFIGAITTVATSLDVFSSHQYLLVVGLYLVVPFIDSNFITPKFIGKSTGIQPVWLLFSICACVSVLGTVGVFISVPMAVILSTVCKEFIKKI